jgi:hypothetical protein
MKALVTAIALAFATFAVQAADTPKAAENTNCVKKDKNGKCPPPPKGEKPTPKKKAEAK